MPRRTGYLAYHPGNTKPTELKLKQVVPLTHNPSAIWLRLTRRGPAIEVSYALDGATYTMLRLAYLTEQATVLVGPMCAAPDGDGFQVTFDGFIIRRHS